MKKRLLSILMALALLLSLLPTAALAASDPDKLVFDISEGSVIIDEGTEAGTIKVTYGNGQVKTPSRREAKVPASLSPMAVR